jgi:hypothetical protein
LLGTSLCTREAWCSLTQAGVRNNSAADRQIKKDKVKLNPNLHTLPLVTRSHIGSLVQKGQGLFPVGSHVLMNLCQSRQGIVPRRLPCAEGTGIVFLWIFALLQSLRLALARHLPLHKGGSNEVTVSRAPLCTREARCSPAQAGVRNNCAADRQIK